MAEINNYTTYFDEICQSYEAMKGVKGAIKIVGLPFDINDWDALGKHYEQTVNKRDRSPKGQFFTPKLIVNYLLDTVEFTSKGSIADISCGSGRFLIEALHRKIQDNLSIEEIRNSIYGFDIDPILTRITLANIRSILSDNDYEVSVNDSFNIKTCNSLDVLGNGFDDAIKFDFILGNPPYLKATPKKNYGHPNLYASFIEAGIKHLKPSGKLGYIIPKSFTSGLYFRKLRDILSQEVKVTELVTLHERNSNFDDVLQEQLLLTLENKSEKPTTITVGLAHTNGDFKIHKFSAPFETIFLSRDIMAIPTKETDVTLIKKFFKNGFKSLKQSSIRISTGQIVPFRMKDSLNCSTQNKKVPIYWPHNIEPYKFKPNQIHKKRESEIEVNQKTEKYIMSEPVIAIKRISSKEQDKRIEAAIINPESEYALENHLNYLKRESNNAPSLEVLEKLLNSNLWDYLFRMINGNTQVSAKELEIFPVPHNLSRLEFINEVESAEREIHEIYSLTKEESAVVFSSLK